MNNFIEWSEIDFKKSTGKEKVRCPECDERRTDKRDKSLVVNHNEGFGKCFYCESLTFKEKKDGAKDYSVKTYELPKQDWKNYTELSDNLTKWVEKERKIAQSTLIDLGVTEEKYYQPALRKEVNNLVFNYFEGEVLVNKKYRSGNKKFTQSTGGKPIFYNINSIIGASECYIVEGEFDVLAMHDFGVRNVISVPNGANDNDDYWKNSEPYLKDIEKFIIAVDNDEKGNDLKEKIAQRLGRWRCEFIEWTNKDANGDLIEGVLDESLSSRRQFPVSGTFTVDDMIQDILELHEKGVPDTISPKHHSFGNIKDVFSVMRGHLVTITGIPSHGKSNFTEWYVLNLIKDYQMKASFFSPEHTPMHLHQSKFIEKAIGRNFFKDFRGCPNISVDDIHRYKDWANERLYLTAPEKGEAPTWDWILEKFKEQMFCFGTDIFVIDAFNKLQLPKGPRLEAINDVLTKLTMFAQMNNVIVFLVAHPTKMRKNESGLYDEPTLYDVSGSADFRNQTHDGYGIYRFFASEEINQDGYVVFRNLKTKQSFQGDIGGCVEYDYHIPSGRYFERGGSPAMYDLTREVVSEPKPMFPNDEFMNEVKEIEDEEPPF